MTSWDDLATAPIWHCQMLGSRPHQPKLTRHRSGTRVRCTCGHELGEFPSGATERIMTAVRDHRARAILRHENTSGTDLYPLIGTLAWLLMPEFVMGRVDV